MSAQDPGRIIPETKLDITLTPVRFLAGAVGAWDPHAAFGRVQDQAVGYLFPMGPFFALGHLLGLAPWVVQRLWIGGLLATALVGAHRVASRLGVATAPGRVLAALSYSLSPTLLSTVGFQSVGQLPTALAPWVVLPLLRADGPHRARRAAAASALAVAAMGGVNATATVVALGPAAVWLATRAPGPNRRRLARRWSMAVAAAVLWWLIPLLVTVRHGLRFTRFTEQAVTTTSTESALDIWRGTGNWLARLSVAGHPWVPGANALATSGLGLVAGTALAAVGAAGLVRRDAPGRDWLIPTALLGAIALGAGRSGSAAGVLAPLARHLLDGPLAALRNVHKAAPLVQLPLAVGTGHQVAAWTGHRNTGRAGARRRARAAAAPTALAALIVAAVAPAAGRLTVTGSFPAIPEGWAAAAHWLDTRPGPDRTLLLPVAAFAEYRWGRPLDEPIGILGQRPWVGRDLVPLGGNGSTRLLDELDRALTARELPPGFVPALRRAGIGWILVRNDLDRRRTGGPDPRQIRRHLRDAPGLDRVAAFGRVEASGRHGASIRSIDLYRVDHPTPPITTYPVRGVLAVSGGPEAMVALPDRLTRGRGVLIGPDGQGLPARDRSATVATDTARRRIVNFGLVRDAAGPTLTATEERTRRGEVPEDRWGDDTPPARTTARLLGARTLRGASPPGRPDHGPAAALDGDPATWWSPGEPAVGRSLSLGFATPRPIGAVTVLVHDPSGGRVTGIAVTTDHGTRWAAPGRAGLVRIPGSSTPTRRLRITITAETSRDPFGLPGLAEVRVDGAPITRPLVTAATDRPATSVVLGRLTRDGFDPSRTDEDGRLDRLVTIAGGRTWRLTGTASAQPPTGPAGRAGPVARPCGRGPDLHIDGQVIPTRLTGRFGGPGRDDRLQWAACTRPRLGAGRHRVEGGAEAIRITTLLGRSARPGHTPAQGSPPGRPARHDPYPTPGARRVTILGWGSQVRTVRLTAGPATLLVTGENQNDGWRATLDGRPLRAVRVDGWRQGFLIPQGAAGRVTLRFAPDGLQRRGLVVGALALVALVAAAASPERRPNGAVIASERFLRSRAPVARAGAIGLVLAGPVGLAAAVWIGALTRVRPRGDAVGRRVRGGDSLPVVIAVLVGVAGAAATAAGPATGTFTSAVQIAAAAAWAMLSVG